MTILHEVVRRRNLLLGLLIGLLLMGGLFKGLGYEGTWKFLNVSAEADPFMDTRVLTNGAIAYRLGIDPLYYNVGEDTARLLNYPPVWQGLYRLGLNEHDKMWFGTMLIGLFLAGIVIATPPPRAGLAAWMAVAAFSPVALLGMERGNIDLAMFFLLALAIALARRHPAWALAIILAGFVGKLYPLAGLVLLLGRDRREAVRGAAIALGFVVLYLLFSLQDLAAIQAATPQAPWLSYGRDVIWLAVGVDHPLLMPVWAWACWAVAGGTLAVAWWWRRSVPATAEGWALDGFRTGAACYLGTFWLGTNFDYRMIFLLFAIPQLWAWATAPGDPHRISAWIAFIGVFACLWAALIKKSVIALSGDIWIGYYVAELPDWIAYVSLTWLFFRHLPAWLPCPGKSAAQPGTGAASAPAGITPP